MRNDLSVGPGAKAVSLGFKRGTELGKVVDLAVLHRPDGTRLVRQGLAPALAVLGAQAARAAGGARTRDQKLVVRPAIGDPAKHDFDRGRIGPAEDAGDPAHG